MVLHVLAIYCFLPRIEVGFRMQDLGEFRGFRFT